MSTCTGPYIAYILIFVYSSIPVSASNGDGSIHKAVQLLVQLMVENTQGLHRDNATDAMKRTLAAKLTVYSLDLTEDHEVSTHSNTHTHTHAHIYAHTRIHTHTHKYTCAHTCITYIYTHYIIVAGHDYGTVRQTTDSGRAAIRDFPEGTVKV